MGKMNSNLAGALSVCLAAMALSACSKGSSSDSSSTGGISVYGSLTQQSASGLQDPVSAFETSFSTANTTLSLDCGASGQFSAAVDPTTGSFNASGVPTGVPCTFSFVSATSSVIKCQVQFQSSDYDLNHNPMSTSTATATSNVNLGSITCASDGTITIPPSTVSNVSASSSVAASTAFDFTGSWTAAAFDGALPTGYQTVTSCTTNCHGPGAGDPISLVRFHGQKFTPNSGQCTPSINVVCPTSSGTVDATEDGYGMSIWGGDYAHGIGACGGNTGFTADEARAYAGVSLDSTPPSLSGHALTYAHFAWSTPSGFGTDTGWTQPWMYGTATSNWNVQDCQPVSVPSTSGGSPKAGYACFAHTVTNGTPNSVYVWSVGLQNAGGCVDSSGNPLMVTNWASLTGTCTSQASTFNSNLTTNSCTYTGAAVSGGATQTFTCSFTGGSFTDIAGPTHTASTDDNGPDFSHPYTMPANTWQGQPATLIAQGAACANTATGHDEATLKTAAAGSPSAAQAAAAKELLVRYQCYANAYWQHSEHGVGSTSCSRDYNFNWSTNDYAQFVTGDDRSMKPQNAFITDRVFYSPDGQWAFLKNVQTHFQSLPTVNGSTLCPMDEIVQLKFHRVNDNKLLVDFSQTTVMKAKSATCQAAVAAALAGGGTLSPDPQNLNSLYEQLQPQHMLFYLTK